MSTPTPTDPREENPETVHGFTLPSGCNAAYLDHWKEFAKFYSEKIGGEAHPRDSHAKMLLEFYVEGGFQEFQRNQSTNSKLAAEIAELKATVERCGEAINHHIEIEATLRAELEAANAREEFLKSKGLTVGMLTESGKEPHLAYVIEPESELCDLRYIHENLDLKRELEAARKERDEAKAQFQKARELKEKYFWELGQIEVSIDGEGKIEGTGWSVAHKKVLELISIRDEANAFTKHVGGPTFKDSVDVILRTKSQDEDKIAEMFDIIKRTGADLDTALAAKDAAEKERDESREHAKNGWRMCDQYRVMLDREKVQRNAAETDRKQLIEVVKFYCDPNNFTVTVWEDETQDGKCWSEPAKDHGLAECYGPTKFGDFGIRALETLESLTPAPTQDPPAGGVTISNETVGIIPTATTPTEASPDVSALGAEAASHPISTEKKGGDEPCHKTNALAEDAQCSPEVTHTTALVASNSPADVPSEGRGELLPFDLEQALTGARIVTRDGREVKRIEAGEVTIDVWTDRDAFSVWGHGRYRVTGEHPLDLFMLPTEGSVA